MYVCVWGGGGEGNVVMHEGTQEPVEVAQKVRHIYTFQTMHVMHTKYLYVEHIQVIQIQMLW